MRPRSDPAGVRALACALFITLLAIGCGPEPPVDHLRLDLFNPHAEEWVDAPVVLRLEHYGVPLTPNARVFRVHRGVEREVPSQLDDMDGDGTPDHLFFLVNMDANETARFVVRRDSVPVEVPSRPDLVVDTLDALDETVPALILPGGPLALSTVDSVRQHTIAAGPLRSIVRTTYHVSLSDESAAEAVVEREHHAGSNWVHQRLRIDPGVQEVRFAAGIPRLGGTSRLESGTFSGVFSIFTVREDANAEDADGAALLIPERLRPRMEPNGPDYRVRFDAENHRAGYRYQVGPLRAAVGDTTGSLSRIQSAIAREAVRWMNPIQIVVAR